MRFGHSYSSNYCSSFVPYFVGKKYTYIHTYISYIAYYWMVIPPRIGCNRFQPIHIWTMDHWIRVNNAVNPKNRIWVAETIAKWENDSWVCLAMEGNPLMSCLMFFFQLTKPRVTTRIPKPRYPWWFSNQNPQISHRSVVTHHGGVAQLRTWGQGGQGLVQLVVPDKPRILLQWKICGSSVITYYLVDHQ